MASTILCMEIRVLGPGDLDAAAALVVAGAAHDVPVHADPAGVLAGFREVAVRPGLTVWLVTEGADIVVTGDAPEIDESVLRSHMIAAAGGWWDTARRGSGSLSSVEARS